MTNILATDNYSIIYGYGVTGESVARYFEEKGENYIVVDGRSDQKLKEKFEQRFPGRSMLLGDVDLDLLTEARRIVLSPGVPRKSAPLKAAIAAGVEVLGDIQLFLEAFDRPVVGVTGSNGKSTVVTLLGKVLEDAGCAVGVGGNIGTPALDLLALNPEVVVLELSSFQLESVARPNLTAACVLNISPDHMDRYDSLQEYCMTKQKIYWGAEALVCNGEDLLTQPPIVEGVKRYSFGLSSSDITNKNHYWFDRESNWLYKNQDQLVHSSDIKMVGEHNVENALAVFALADILSVDASHVKNVLAEFVGLEHRCEWVAESAGVTFINDSKGTNVGATVAAIKGLEAQYENLILLCGGEGKGADFSELGRAIEEKVSVLAVFGKDSAAILNSVGPAYSAKASYESMEHAFNSVLESTNPGDAVLLSPACASFDMFQNYQERGNTFKSLVQAHVGR